jgi:amidase
VSDLAFLSATALANLIEGREISSEELLHHYLERADRFNPEINAIVVDLREQALKRAREADAATARGESWGPLHGVPMTVKESFKISGAPTTHGRPEWRDEFASEDAVAVSKLRQAGAVIFGKTNVPLSLADFQSYNDVYGTTNNPYDLTRTPGGSSGGSAAALAAGLTGLEAGSDIGGSIRNPAHFCGVFGHKPTWNLLCMRGHAPPQDVRAPSDISVIGPLARSARDLDTAVRALAGPDDIMARGYRLDLPEPSREQLNGLRVAVWDDDAHCPVSAEVKSRVDLVTSMLADAGAVINRSARPDFSTEHSHEVYENLLHATMSARKPDEEYESLRRYTDNLDPDDQSQAARVFRAQVASFKDWRRNNELREHLRWKWHDFFSRYDVLLTPIMPTAAFPHDHRPFGERTIMVDNQELPYFQQTFWAGLTGVAFLPSTVIPTGLNAEGLPIGVQIVGPEYADLITIGVAHELELRGCRFTPPGAYNGT